MQNWLIRKGLVLGIIVLFIGASAVPGMSDKGKDRDIIYVNWDGTGDYTTIQEGIDNASDGDIVYVYNGSYTENIEVDKTISLVGQDNNGANIFDAGEKDYIVLISGKGAEVRGLSIKGNGTSETDTGVELAEECIEVSWNKITDCDKGVWGNGVSSGSNLICLNIIENCGQAGIWLEYYSHGNFIFGNTIRDIDDYGILLSNSGSNLVEYNILDNMNIGISIEDGMSMYNQIIGNTFKNCSSWGIYIWETGYFNLIIVNNFYDLGKTWSTFWYSTFMPAPTNFWVKNYNNDGNKYTVKGTVLMFIPYRRLHLSPSNGPNRFDLPYQP